MKKGKNFP